MISNPVIFRKASNRQFITESVQYFNVDSKDMIEFSFLSTLIAQSLPKVLYLLEHMYVVHFINPAYIYNVSHILSFTVSVFRGTV